MPRTSKAAGSVALVTGANRGIGLAFVQELAARGARKVYAGVRSPGDVTSQFKELPVEVVPLDVTELALVQAAAVGCPDVNLLVNNAGLFTNHRLVLTDDPDAARREMEVNYFGVLNMTPGLRARPRGQRRRLHRQRAVGGRRLPGSVHGWLLPGQGRGAVPVQHHPLRTGRPGYRGCLLYTSPSPRDS